MNRIDLLFVQVGEEASEVAQEASKCLRFGPDEIYPVIGITNAERVKAEFNDLLAVIEMLQEEGAMPMPLIDREMIEAKKIKVEKNISYSATRGRVE